jgi:hypothetical protein
MEFAYSLEMMRSKQKVMMEVLVQREFEVEIREALGEFVSFVCYFIHWRQVRTRATTATGLFALA